MGNIVPNPFHVEIRIRNETPLGIEDVIPTDFSIVDVKWGGKFCDYNLEQSFFRPPHECIRENKRKYPIKSGRELKLEFNLNPITSNNPVTWNIIFDDGSMNVFRFRLKSRSRGWNYVDLHRSHYIRVVPRWIFWSHYTFIVKATDYEKNLQLCIDAEKDAANKKTKKEAAERMRRALKELKYHDIIERAEKKLAKYEKEWGDQLMTEGYQKERDYQSDIATQKFELAKIRYTEALKYAHTEEEKAFYQKYLTIGEAKVAGDELAEDGFVKNEEALNLYEEYKKTKNIETLRKATELFYETKHLYNDAMEAFEKAANLDGRLKNDMHKMHGILKSVSLIVKETSFTLFSNDLDNLKFRDKLTEKNNPDDETNEIGGIKPDDNYNGEIFFNKGKKH